MRRHLTDVHQVQDPSKCCKYKVQSNFKRYGIYYCVKDVHVTEAAEVPSDVNNKRAALIEALPFTAEISNTDDYTSNADFTDHRERLTNEYMNALKVTQFIIDMLPSDKNNIEGRQLLNKFRSKEKNNVSAEFNHIRYAVETCFFRLQKVLKKLPWGAHFFAEQVMRTTTDEKATKAMRSLEDKTDKEYYQCFSRRLLLLKTIT
ncbi:hypothetical protein MBANPS3_008287 [Mucor bainieri]